MIRLGAVSLVMVVALIGHSWASAEPLAKTGKFTLHSGYKSANDATVQIAPNRLLLSGQFFGVTFNDKGAGPLHRGWAICNYAGELVDGAGSFVGQCTWHDADGDKIFADYTGTLPPGGGAEGINRFNGGTGKFTGIQGKGPFHCNGLGSAGQYVCNQEFEYRLP